MGRKSVYDEAEYGRDPVSESKKMFGNWKRPELFAASFLLLLLLVGLIALGAALMGWIEIPSTGQDPIHGLPRGGGHPVQSPSPR